MVPPVFIRWQPIQRAFPIARISPNLPDQEPFHLYRCDFQRYYLLTYYQHDRSQPAMCLTESRPSAGTNIENLSLKLKASYLQSSRHSPRRSNLPRRIHNFFSISPTKSLFLGGRRFWLIDSLKQNLSSIWIQSLSRVGFFQWSGADSKGFQLCANRDFWADALWAEHRGRRFANTARRFGLSSHHSRALAWASQVSE